MTPWFVLSYPRSRTAWLSVFLTGSGVPCFHEAWKQVQTGAEMRLLMEQCQAPVVVNSDCSNVFFMKDLQAEFPEARYLRIYQPEHETLASLRDSYGNHDYTAMMLAYQRAFDACHVSTVDVWCESWDLECSAWLFEQIAGRSVDAGWLRQISGMLVQLMPTQIQQDIQAAATGEFSHIAARMGREPWE
jgi:hypothetical protein